MAKTTSGNQSNLETLTRRIRELSAKANLTTQEQSELGEIERNLRYFGARKHTSSQPTAVDSTPVEADVPYFDMPPEGRKRQNSPKRKGKGKRLNKYQNHIKECRLGQGDYDGQGKRDFNECVALWREIKRKRKEL